MANWRGLLIVFTFELLQTCFSSSSYRTDIPESGEMQFCEHRKHLTFKPSATCCMNQVVKPGIAVEDFWDECSQEVAGRSNTINQIGWDLYACILKKANGGKEEISLKEFSDLMTANYSDEIKGKINEEIEAQSVASAALTDHEKLKVVWATYYDIETEVCEGMPSETKSYGKTAPCSSWTDEMHRGGMCCKESYPVDIRFKTLMDLEDRDGIMRTCRESIKDELPALQVTETMEHSMMEICDLACAMAQSGLINFKEDIIDNKEYWKWNATIEVRKERNGGRRLLPAIFHQDLAQQAESFAASTYNLSNTIESIQNFEFIDVIDGHSPTEKPVHTLTHIKASNKSLGDDWTGLEYMRRKFHPGLLQVPVICSAFKEVYTLFEYQLFKKENCEGENAGPAEPPSPPQPEMPPAEPPTEPETPPAESSPETPPAESPPETPPTESAPETPPAESSPETPPEESTPEAPSEPEAK